MRIQKQGLLLFSSLFLFIFFPIIGLASTTTSQVGIFFTENDEAEVTTETLTEDKLSNMGDKEARKQNNLPQTGEGDQSHILILWSILLLNLVIVIYLVKMGVEKIMLKRRIVVGLISASFLFSSTLVSAAPEDTIIGSENGKGGTSHGYIKLTPGDNVVDPTKPIKPTNPPGGTGNVGTLTVDNVAPLLFDAHKLEGKERVYTSVVKDSNVQVTDNRGEETGWNLQVSQTPFTDIVDSTKKLKGAKLELPIGVIETAGTNVSLSPTVLAVEVNETPSVLMNALAGSGAGTWTSVFNQDEIKLTVPAGNRNGEYRSTVTWSLLDAPK